MHIVQDKYLSRGLVEAARATWPSPDWGHWITYGSGKLASKSPYQLPRACDLILSQLAECPVGRVLYGLNSNRPTIFPDLEYLHGAGLHQMLPGHDLGLHLDTERHPNKPWKREATAILYLDSMEDCEHRGELDLTDASGNLEKRIEPEVNRLVVFSTPGQWHRVNKCDSMRRSICLFFWSVCSDDFVGGTRANFV
jgi:hypothetical protein